jgi:triosephosphate isomerase
MSERTYFIAGNWKMNTTSDDALALVRQIIAGQPDLSNTRAAVCPPFTNLSAVAELLKDSPLELGAQNCHQQTKGAYTGEVSAEMLKAVDCEYVILGHSERRQYFGENDALINEKTKAALAADLQVIVCVGETEAEREAGKTASVVDAQVRGCLAGMSAAVVADNVTIAYEPVWAIGTGKTATPEMAQEVHKQIRELLEELFSNDTAEQVAIQYGGSMKPENAKDLLAQPDIDGGLIGGAALKADSFLELLRIAAEAS